MKRMVGPDAFGGVGGRTLYAQLDALGKIGVMESGRGTRKLYVGGAQFRVLHLKSEAIPPKVIQESEPPEPWSRQQE
jgi:hypothetical protein